MSAQEWGIVIGAATSALLAVGPWMVMVHAKLAVIAHQIGELSRSVEKAAAAQKELWSLLAEHEARLQTHGVQFAHVAERLRDLE
jgi:hypothetical protein